MYCCDRSTKTMNLYFLSHVLVFITVETYVPGRAFLVKLYTDDYYYEGIEHNSLNLHIMNAQMP